MTEATETFHDHQAIRELLDRFVARDPVRGTMFGTLGRQLTESAWAAVNGDRLAMRTAADGPVVLSGDWPDVDVLRALPDLHGLNGAPAVVEPLVAQLAGGRDVRRMAQGLYRLDELTRPVGVVGHAERAGTARLDLVGEWFAAFAAEAFATGHRDTAALAERAIADGAWIWLDGDGRPVSMAARRPVIGGSARIGPVFTPQKHRTHGYGSAVTACATADVLADGAIPVLFTDLANPTSNKIYQAMGYRFVEDRVVATFD